MLDRIEVKSGWMVLDTGGDTPVDTAKKNT